MQIYTPKGYVTVKSLAELRAHVNNNPDSWFNFDTSNARVKCTIDTIPSKR